MAFQPYIRLLLLTSLTKIWVLGSSAFKNAPISAVSWGAGSVDVFGLTLEGTVWHKCNRGAGWLPSLDSFQSMNTSKSISRPTTISSQPNRMDLMYIAENHEAHLRYWLGKDWNPAEPEILGSGFSSAITAYSWAPDRINIVAREADNSYWHCFWDSIRWRPIDTDHPNATNITTWEPIGGQFASQAALASPDTGRMDIFGIAFDGSLKHKYWDHNHWVPSISEWEDIEGGPFIDKPTASSWGPGRLDLWALGEDKRLYHKYWNKLYSFSEWEDLGGNFSSMPQVVHWGPNRTDLVGMIDTEVPRSKAYSHKYWNGSHWNPSSLGWDSKGGNFVTDPAVATSEPNNLHIFGIHEDGYLKQQIWDGSRWLPSTASWYNLGSIRNQNEATIALNEEL